MSRCVQQLLRSTWCRWQLVTSLPLPANQEALSVAHQWSPTALGVVRGGWRRPSVRLLHRAGPQYCGGAESSPGAAGPNDDDDDDLGRPAIAKTSMPEGPEGAAASTDQDGNSLAGLVSRVSLGDLSRYTCMSTLPSHSTVSVCTWISFVQHWNWENNSRWSSKRDLHLHVQPTITILIPMSQWNSVSAISCTTTSYFWNPLWCTHQV